MNENHDERGRFTSGSSSGALRRQDTLNLNGKNLQGHPRLAKIAQAQIDHSNMLRVDAAMTAAQERVAARVKINGR